MEILRVQNYSSGVKCWAKRHKKWLFCPISPHYYTF